VKRTKKTFCPRPAYVGLVVDGEALGQVLLQAPRPSFTFVDMYMSYGWGTQQMTLQHDLDTKRC